MTNRITTAAVVVLSILLVTGIASTSDQPTYSHGLIENSCAPWDGLAIAITLTPDSPQCGRVTGPYVSMGVWRGLPIHDGQVVKFGEGSDAGYASRCRKEGDCERAQSGSITFEKYEGTSGARGRYELHFKNGETLAGSFQVRWCENRMICG